MKSDGNKVFNYVINLGTALLQYQYQKWYLCVVVIAMCNQIVCLYKWRLMGGGGNVTDCILIPECEVNCNLNYMYITNLSANTCS